MERSKIKRKQKNIVHFPKSQTDIAKLGKNDTMNVSMVQPSLTKSGTEPSDNTDSKGKTHGDDNVKNTKDANEEEEKKLAAKIKELKSKQSDLEKRSKQNLNAFRFIQIVIAIISVLPTFFGHLQFLTPFIAVLVLVDSVTKPRDMWNTQELSSDGLLCLIDHCENGVVEFDGITNAHKKLSILTEKSEAILEANSMAIRTIINQMEYVKNQKNTTQESH